MTPTTKALAAWVAKLRPAAQAELSENDIHALARALPCDEPTLAEAIEAGCKRHIAAGDTKRTATASAPPVCHVARLVVEQERERAEATVAHRDGFEAGVRALADALERNR